MASSHHVQAGSPPTMADCQVCHVTTSHMLGTVKLRSAEDGSTITYSNESSATDFCLGCHDDNSKTSTPFSDLRTPVSSEWNWDGKSVKIKYSTTEVVSSNKYPPTVTAPNMGAPYNTVPDVQRALSAHGNPGQNKANGTTSDARVPCLACHNSHGSPVAPLLFSTNTYVPQNMENFCWDCHTNDPASPQKASDYMPDAWVKDYFGDPRWGLNAGSGFTINWMGSFAYKNSSFMSSHFYPSKDQSGNDWPRSGLTCTDCHDPHGVDPGQTATKAYMVPLLKGTWLISPYKEDRAPLASFSSALKDGTVSHYSNADQPRGNPDLAYNNTPNPGGGYADGTGGAGHEGFFIDDNTFGTYNPTNLSPAASGSWRSVLSAGKALQMNRIAENDTLFAGLCLRCHQKTDLQSAWSGHGTVKGWGGAKRDLFPSSMVGSGGGEGPGNGMHSMSKYDSSESEGGGAYARGYRWGVNPKTQKTSGYIQTDYHQFPCSKCHSPHASNMPRLLTTNCLDSKGNHTSYAKSVAAQANNCHSTQRDKAWTILTPWIQTSAPVKFTIIASSNSGGTISPAGASLVETGTDQAFTMTANSGYALSDVKVDGVSQGAIASYAFSNVSANHTISATFVSTTVNLIISASAGTGGTISPSGNVTVAFGASRAFTITPNSGYAISDVKVDNVSQGAIASYTFGNVKTAHTISATFVTTRNITASAGTGGTITPIGIVPVSYGASQAFTITPNIGYKINQVVVDGTNQGAIASYTFTNVTATHTISATFATVPIFTITASAGTGGTISPAGNVQVNSGSSQTFTITPNDGYQITNVTADGTSQGAVSTYTFTNILAAHTISAAFAIKTYTLSASVNAGGTITPAGNTVVNHGAGQTYAIAATAGYVISGVKVDDVPQGPITSYTFTNVTANHTISATICPVDTSKTIVASAATGGTITPSGNVSVAYGDSQNFTIDANYGYAIADVKVDDISRGAIGSFAFSNVTTNHSISVTYVTTIPNFVITASAGTGGTISPAGSINVWSGDSQSFNVFPSVGYAISDLIVDGVSRGPVAAFSFSNVTAAHSISVAFVSTGPTYTITASAGTGGTIAPSGSVVVSSGSNATFNIAANTGYAISNVTVDGAPQGAISTYTFPGVTASHTISATFFANIPPTANAGSDKTGSVGAAISFTGSGTDTDGTIASYSWNWGDGTAETNTQNASHTYAVEGPYTATLTVTDNEGATGTDTAAVTVNAAPPVNIALNKTASASSQYSSTYAASKAVDGSASTYWRSSSTGTQWIMVNLGANYIVPNVKVSWSSTYHARSFQIQTSPDGTNFTTQFSTTTGTSTATNATFTPVSTRYVRIYCTVANSSSYRITELEVYGTPAPNQAPVANAGSDKAGYAGAAISFTGSGTDSDGTIAGYSWNWGDSSPDTNTQNASHTYDATGTYTATLTVTDNQGATGSDTAVVTVTVAPPNQPPTANAGSDKTGSVGAAISFTGSGTDTDGTIASYSWNWGDGTADTNTQNASHTYATADTYTATLTVTDNLGATGSDSVVVTVNEVPVNIALNKPVTYSTQYSTTNSASKAVDGSTSTYWRSSSSGTQWLRVDLGANYIVPSVKVSWYSTSYYARSFQIQTSLDGTNFTTQFSTTSGTTTATTATFAPVSARYVRLYCTVAYGSNYRVTELEVYGTPAPNQAPVANAGSDKAGYAGAAISFTGSGTDSDGTIAGYSWNWGDSSPDTNTQNASHTYAATGTYTATLTITDNQGATGSDTAVVTVTVAPPNQAPVANAGSDKTGNAGTAISFTGSGTDPDGTITGYSWNWGDGTADTNTQNASHTYAVEGPYTATLTVTDNAGAIGSDTALVTVSAAPAGVAQLDSWTNIYTAAPNNSSATNLNVGSVTVGSGSNRLLLVSVVMELSSAANKTVSASLGGTSLTQVALTANSQREIVWVGRFNDAQIGSGAKTLTITYSGSGTVTGLHVKWASYTGVNQSTPVASSAARNSTSTTSSTFGSTVNYVIGGMTTVVSVNGGSTSTGTLNATPSFTAGTATQASSLTSRPFVTAKHTAAGSYSSSTAVSWSSGSTGSGLVAVSLQP